MVTVLPPDRQCQRAADGPQHDDEGGRREKRLRDTCGEIDRRIGRNPQILCDPVFRILVIAVDQIELIVAAIVSHRDTTEFVSHARQRL